MMKKLEKEKVESKKSWGGEVLHKLWLMLSKLLKNTILYTIDMSEKEGDGRHLWSQEKDEETMKSAEASYNRTHSGEV